MTTQQAEVLSAEFEDIETIEDENAYRGELADIERVEREIRTEAKEVTN